MFVKPWNKEADRILKQLSRKGKAYTTDINFTRTWSRRYPGLDDYIEIYRNDKKKKSAFIPMEDITIIQRPKSKRFEIIRIF